jgi:hypothetical protein
MPPKDETDQILDENDAAREAANDGYDKAIREANSALSYVGYLMSIDADHAAVTAALDAHLAASEKVGEAVRAKLAAARAGR